MEREDSLRMKDMRKRAKKKQAFSDATGEAEPRGHPEQLANLRDWIDEQLDNADRNVGTDEGSLPTADDAKARQ